MKIALVMPHTAEEFGICSDEDYAQHDGYEHQYARLIKRMGHEPIIYLMSHREGTSEFFHKFGHKIVRVPVSLSFGVGKQFSLPLLRRIAADHRKGSIDICHVFSYYVPQYDLFAIMCRMYGIPLVAQMHSGGGTFHYILRYPFLLFTLRMADKVLYVQPKEEAHVHMLFTEGEFFPNWVDRSTYRKMNLKRKNAVLFVGGIGNAGRREHKGVDILLETFKKLQKEFRGLELTLIGRYEEEWARGVTANGVNILGHVPSEELVRAYNTHKLCIFPSRVEPFSLVTLESLACGTPAVITDAFGSAPFLKKEGYELIARSGDVESLFKLASSALRDESVRKRNVQIGNRVIDEYFNEETIGKRLIGIYKSILH